MSGKTLGRAIHDDKIKAVALELLKHGFVLVSERNHLKFKSMDGRMLILPKTSSDRRAWLTVLSKLRRYAGIDFFATFKAGRKAKVASAA